FVSTRNVQVTAARCAGADEDRVETLVEDGGKAIDALAEARLDPSHVEDVADFLIDDRLRQPEPGDLAADHPAPPRVRTDQCQLVAQRREITRHRQRSRSGADQCDPLPVLRAGGGNPSGYVFLVVVRDAL